MKKLLSGNEVRWWFRSRKSEGHLSSLSYWLCVLLMSAALSLVLGALWQAYTAERTRLRRASEQMDWLERAPLKALEPYRETFVKQRNVLVNRVRYGDQSPGGGDLPLRPAVDIRDRNRKLPSPSSMFGNPDVEVYPSFATFSPKEGGRKLSEAEMEVFNNFANAVTSLYRHRDNDGAHVERSLTAAFGLNGPDAGASPFDVPWVYVASDTGAIAVFPGTHVIGEPRWKTTSRPWFQAALGGDAQLFTKGLLAEDLLTTVYLDVLAKRPMLVRTYMYKFEFKPKNARPGAENASQEFVVCIDIFRDESRAAATAPAAATPDDFRAAFVKAALPPQALGPVHYVTFGLSILFFLALRWVSATHTAELTFERTQSLVGRLRVEDGLRTQNDELTTQEKRVGVEFAHYAGGKVQRGAQETKNVAAHTSVEKSLVDLRGYELWEVSHDVSASWGILGIRFRGDRSTYVGTIRLTYTSKVLPEAEWVSFNASAFPEARAAELHDRLPKLLARNADQCESPLKVPERGADFSAYLRAPDLPDWVRSVAAPKELLAVRQRRAYVRLTSERVGQLYAKAEVKAVMASGFFEELLNNGQFDFLLNGKTITRLISLPDETAELHLHDAAWRTLAELMNSHFTGGARRLKRLSRPIGDQGEPSPVYDFAILDDEFVIVAHSVSKTAGIDCASGTPTKATYVVEGYVSWRKADVEYYRGLFSDLDEQARTLSLPAEKLEVIGGRFSSFEAESGWA
ncbi:MAG: hypothetical protein ACJ74T_06490 [Pyrinomonadaceae bacterium]